MFYVYVLKSKEDGSLYTGYTEDLRKRFAEHNAGKTKSIRHRIPFKLVYYEAYADKTDARRRELELKTKGQQREILMDKIRNSLII